MSDADGMLAVALSDPQTLAVSDLAALLACAEPGFDERLFAAAREVKRQVGRTETLPRGLIECSNVCAKDCRYCGIRKSNAKVFRYRLSEAAALACVAEARRRGYPAVAFQAGEIESEANTRYYERLLAGCAGLEVTLSLGEQTEEVYQRWKAAGALRYLLRIESSDRELYSRIHPSDCSYDRRVECLHTLKRLGYVTGSGVMIGLPGQTVEHLAKDLVFFASIPVDMVGMGPFIEHPDTPLFGCGDYRLPFPRLAMALRMIALARLYLRDVNIVAATALETLDPSHGRERGLAAGANVMMPNVTPADYGANYTLYPGKFSVSRLSQPSQPISSH